MAITKEQESNIGQAAIACGFISQQQWDECLQIQSQLLQQKGQSVSVVAIMKKKFEIQDEQLAQIQKYLQQRPQINQANQTATNPQMVTNQDNTLVTSTEDLNSSSPAEKVEMDVTLPDAGAMDSQDQTLLANAQDFKSDSPVEQQVKVTLADTNPNILKSQDQTLVASAAQLQQSTDEAPNEHSFGFQLKEDEESPGGLEATIAASKSTLNAMGVADINPSSPISNSGVMSNSFLGGTNTLTESALAKGANTETRPQVPTPPRAQTNLRQFGRYEIIQEIGQGGMGKVYKARDPQLDRIIALKVLLAGGGANTEEVQRFLREARATANLQHPNIVNVYDIGCEQNQYFFTMDFIEGDSLKQKIKKKPLTLTQACNQILKIGSAVQFAHSKGVIHRDLKPDNVMMQDGVTPKVMDFGLAKVMRDSAQLSKSGMVMGTLQYMPPEQAEGRTSAIDHQSDVYSLGAIFYEMVTGRPPFTGQTTFQIIHAIMQADPTPPSELRPGCPKAIDIICSKVMAKSKQDRYPNVQSFLRDIRYFMQNPNAKAKQTFRWQPLYTKILAGIIALLAILTVVSDDPKPRLEIKVIGDKWRATSNKLLANDQLAVEVRWKAYWFDEYDSETVSVLGDYIDERSEDFKAQRKTVDGFRMVQLPIKIENPASKDYEITIRLFGKERLDQSASFSLYVEKTPKQDSQLAKTDPENDSQGTSSENNSQGTSSENNSEETGSEIPDEDTSLDDLIEDVEVGEENPDEEDHGSEENHSDQKNQGNEEEDIFSDPEEAGPEELLWEDLLEDGFEDEDLPQQIRVLDSSFRKYYNTDFFQHEIADGILVRLEKELEALQEIQEDENEEAWQAWRKEWKKGKGREIRKKIEKMNNSLLTKVIGEIADIAEELESAQQGDIQEKRDYFIESFEERMDARMFREIIEEGHEILSYMVETQVDSLKEQKQIAAYVAQAQIATNFFYNIREHIPSSKLSQKPKRHKRPGRRPPHEDFENSGLEITVWDLEAGEPKTYNVTHVSNSRKEMITFKDEDGHALKLNSFFIGTYSLVELTLHTHKKVPINAIIPLLIMEKYDEGGGFLPSLFPGRIIKNMRGKVTDKIDNEASKILKKIQNSKTQELFSEDEEDNFDEEDGEFDEDDMPSKWPQELWEECWDDDDELVDFTGAKWLSLPHQKQLSLARSYQKWYADFLEQPVTRMKIIPRVLIPPGKFRFYHDGGKEGKGKIITIEKAFYVSMYEVSQAVAKHAYPIIQRQSTPKNDQYPVNRVTWSEARQFCPALFSKLKNVEKNIGEVRLPSQTEWEYIMRGGTTKRYFWGNDYKKGKNFAVAKDSGGKVARVNRGQSNSFLVWNTMGNVAEWCMDDFSKSPEDLLKNGKAFISGSNEKVVRGRSYKNPLKELVSHGFGKYKQNGRATSVGFRVIVEIKN